MWKKWKPYLISLVISLGVGGLSALLTKNNMDLYETIQTPPLSPPSILFPIVWTFLFILMGISAAMIYQHFRKDPSGVFIALTIYAVSLFFNFWWSIIFFNGRMFLFSFIWIILLWFSILLTILHYKRYDKTAAYLQIPYLLWVAFAAYLNIGIYILNS